MELFTSLNFWQWWVIAVIFIVLEMFAPGAFLLWLGIASGVVGLVMLILPGTSWEVQYTLFGVLSILSIVAWRAWQSRHPAVSDQPSLNRRGEQYLNRVFTLAEPIVNGQGKIRVDDSTWKIHGLDMPAGSRVRVTGVDGVVLRVEVE